tara:strand:+ start:2397 stop:3110 length:714 start_codon:yes stop_codon:yes gene_type:complete
MLNVIILAAGKSKRYGTANKLLELDGGGQPIIKRLIRQLCGPQITVTVVCGYDLKRVRRQAMAALITNGGEDDSIVYNPQWHQGSCSSLKIGIQNCLRPITDKLLIVEGDLLAHHDTIEEVKYICARANESVLFASRGESLRDRTLGITAPGRIAGAQQCVYAMSGMMMVHGRALKLILDQFSVDQTIEDCYYFQAIIDHNVSMFVHKLMGKSWTFNTPIQLQAAKSALNYSLTCNQ